MRQAGQAANHAAAGNVFEAYRATKSAGTLRAHRAAINVFNDYLAAIHPALATNAHYDDVQAWHGITWGIVEGFKGWQLRQGYALNSINQRLATVKLYLKLAYKADVLTDSEFGQIQVKTSGVPLPGSKAAMRLNENREVTRIGTKKAAAIFIQDSDADCLKNQPDTAVGARDRLLMCLLIDHGLRVSEAAILKLSNIDLINKVMTFERPKTAVPGKHHLTDSTMLALNSWLLIRESVKPDNDYLLLASSKGDKLQNSGMSKRAITKRVAFLGMKCGYSKEKPTGAIVGSLGAHDMRHYCAERMVKLGYDVPALCDWFGWSPNTAVSMIDTYRDRNKVAKRHKG